MPWIKQPRLCRVCGETDPKKFHRQYASICRQCVYNRRQPKSRGYTETSRNKIKTEVLTHYGPSGVLRCSWTACVVSDIDMLVLDHIANDGAAQRKLLPTSSSGRGHELYRKLRNDGYPAGYQTLCCNHNHKKEIIRSRLPQVSD